MKNIFLFLIIISFFVPHVLFGATPQAVILIDELNFYKTNKGYFPDIGITLTQGYAPFPVFFEGWQSTPRAELVRYDWDFGAGTESDEMGRTFEGFNAAHVYEKPGTYTVTLKVTNIAGQTSQVSVPITVLSRDDKTTYYVDSDVGNDTYDGKAATVGGGHGPWQTANKAFSMLRKVTQGSNKVALLNPGDRVLFNRGQTFAFTGTMLNNGTIGLFNLGHGETCQGVQFGAYGNSSLAKPIIQWAGNAELDTSGRPASQYIYSAGYGGADIVWSDLYFNFLNISNKTQVAGVIFAYSAWKNILFLRDDFRDNYESIWELEGLDPAPDGFFTVSCTFNNHQSAFLSVTQIYGGPGHCAILNNKFDESGNHIAYLKTINKGVISKNIFSRPACGRTALRITGGPGTVPGGSPGQGGVGIGNTANNIVISDNRFLGWVDSLIGGAGRAGGSHSDNGKRFNYCLINISANSDGQQLHDWIVFERNVITNFETGMTISNASNMIIRNNIFVTPVAGRAIYFNETSLGAYEPLKNVFVYGNIFLSGSHQIDLQNPWGNYSIVRMAPYVPGDREYGIVDTNVLFYDNIIATYPGGVAPTALELMGTVSGFTSNNNLYYMPNVSGGTFMKQSGTAMTLAAWRTTTHNDLNSVTGDPKFAGEPLTELNKMVPGRPSSQDSCVWEANSLISTLPLAPGSPAIDAGANLGAALYYDFNGGIRPADGNADLIAQTDIGAFEYGASKITTDTNIVPYKFTVYQNYPNPFNPSTTISFFVGTYGYISLKIFDILGREIATLVNGMQSAGEHTIEWKGTNSAGQSVGSGVYFYQLKNGAGLVSTKKMVLIK